MRIIKNETGGVSVFESSRFKRRDL